MSSAVTHFVVNTSPQLSGSYSSPSGSMMTFLELMFSMRTSPSIESL